jgi:hypothetical protein
MLDATLHTNRGNLVAHSGPSSFVGVLGAMFRLLHLLGRPASGAERFYRDQHPKPVFSCPLQQNVAIGMARYVPSAPSRERETLL